MNHAHPKTSFRSVVRHEPPPDALIWALLKQRRGRVHHLRSTWWRRRGNIPGTSQATKTACAMATLEPLVTEGEAARDREGTYPACERGFNDRHSS
jgi:hypothetical protein